MGQNPAPPTPPAPSRADASQRIAAIGLLVNIVLAMVKLIAGILGHSGALIADAIESLADIAGSLVIWSGLRIGAIPADADHPYGHGKAEALAGLVVAGVLVGAGVAIAVESVHAIRTPHESPAVWTLWVLGAVVLVKGGMFLAAKAVARREGSSAVEVDAGHHVSDAITSLAAAIGITVAVFGQRWFGGDAGLWAAADDWAALLAAVIIIWNAVKLGRIPLRELMDAKAPADELGVIEPARAVAMTVPGVRAIEKIHARKFGSGYWLDMHVQVDPLTPVREAHAIGGAVRATLRTQVPRVNDVFIHIEPFEPSVAGQHEDHVSLDSSSSQRA